MTHPDDRFLLGIDAGGSSTTAMLARVEPEGWSPVGRGTSGPGNPVTGDLDTALGQLDAAIVDAFHESGRPRARVESACLAIAGSDRPSARAAVARWADMRQVAASCRIVHDGEPLLAWAAPQETVIALVSGTGSFAWGRDGEGRTGRAGGWGPLLGDEGSGYWLGLHALQAVLQAVDRRGPATNLSALLATQLGTTDWKELPVRIQSLGREAIAALAPSVIAAAQRRDAVACHLVEEAGRQLAAIVRAVAFQLNVHGTLDRLALAGGVLLQSPALQREVQESLQQLGLNIRQVQRVEDPVLGAVELAYRTMLR
jgi:N-acetylglucosamine kinase-like BadF-type ATPase